MPYWGKLLGLISGLLSGAGFWGGLLGLMIGHVLDTRNTGHQRGVINQQARKSLFLRTTFQVMGHLTKAKGRVTEIDIALASQWMDKLQLQDTERLVAQHAFNEGKKSTFPLQEKLRELQAICSNRVDLTKIFIEIQCHMSFSDGILHPHAWQILHMIARELNIPRLQLERHIRMMERQHTGSHQGKNSHSRQRYQHTTRASALADACKVLGVNQDTDNITIKRTWRKLMNEHHPDKLMAKKDISPEVMEQAKQKTQQIQAAYDLIKQEKGFK